jgi:hypothetical protein
VAAPSVRPDRWDALLVGFALVAALARPLTAPAAVAVLAPGVLLLGVRARRPVPPPPGGARLRAAAVVWTALGVAVAGWWLVAFAWGNDAQHPTLSLLLDPVLGTYPGRLAGWLAWLGAGRWLVTR